MKRYTPYFTTEDTQPLYAMREKAEGLYVLYSDAQAEIARLREALSNARLDWAMLCECDCCACDALDARLRALIDERKDAQA